MKFKVPRIKCYSTISNIPIQDKNLSFKSRGLLCYILSLPDDWKFVKTHFYNVSTDSRTAVDSASKELEEKGYIIKTRIRNKEGNFNMTMIFMKNRTTNIRTRKSVP